MTGWRLGYAVSKNSRICELLMLGNFAQSAGVTTFTQLAAAAALEKISEAEEAVRGMRREYRRRRDVLCNGLASIDGIRFKPPGGAFYLFPDCCGLIPGDISTTDRQYYIFNKLLEHGVSVVPGIHFGSHFGDYIRLAYSCTPIAEIETAIARIQSAFRSK